MDLRTAGTQGLDGANRSLKPLVHLTQSVTESAMPSPLDDFREVLRDKAIVVRLELDWSTGSSLLLYRSYGLNAFTAASARSSAALVRCAYAPSLCQLLPKCQETYSVHGA